MKRTQKGQFKSKGLKYASNKQTPFKRGKFEEKGRYNSITPKLHTMSHDFLFRNVYKKQRELTDEKKNHPTSHYRYKFHNSNKRNINTKNKRKPILKKKDKRDNNNDDNIPFYENIDKTKKKHLSDDELDIAESSNDSNDSNEDELKFEHFRKESLKRKYENNELKLKSKWLQSKIKENSELFEGGLDLQGILPHKNRLKQRKGIKKGALVLGAIHSVTDHYAKIYLYGSVPAIITIGEVSDVLSMEINHLIGNKNDKQQSLLNIKQSLNEESLSSSKRQETKEIYYYKTLQELPTCHDIFARHDIIRCIVTHYKENEGYYVSLRPSLFNSKLRINDLVNGYCLLSSIKSIEDKGYVIDTGIYVQDEGGENEISVQAFMSYNDIPTGIINKILHHRPDEETEEEEEEEEEEILPIGFPLNLVVKTLNTKTNSISLTLDFKKYYRELTTLPIVPIIALKPGFLVKCNIKKYLRDGLIVEFGKVYQGVIDFSHVDKILDKKWRNYYEIGQEINARIIMVNPMLKMIHLSIKPHLNKQPNDTLLPQALHYQAYCPRRCGEIITADIRRIAYNSLYLYSKLLDPDWINNDNNDDEKEKDDEDDDEKTLFPPKNKKPLFQMIPIKISGKNLGMKGNDLQNQQVIDSWKKRKNLKVKLLRYDAFQGEFQGSLREEDIEAKVLFYKDIKSGMLFECTVKSIEKDKDKINVSFCNGLSGHISILHCADLPPKSFDESQIITKYAIGNIIKCRVLTCIPYKKYVNLTAKPSLVESNIDNTDPITINNWKVAKNTISSAVVYKMNDAMGYIVVHFYNQVTAIIPGKDLKLNGYLNKPSEEFYIGQTIKVRVIQSNKTTKRMICSLNLNVDKNDDIALTSKKKKDTAKQIYDGDSFWSKIVAKKDNYFIVRKLKNYNINDDDNNDDNEDDNDDDNDDFNMNKLDFHNLKLYSILPFDHLCDNSIQSLNLIDSNAFEIGDPLKVITINQINIHGRNLDKQYSFQNRFIEALGLSQDIINIENSDNKILSIVSAKSGLLHLYEKKTILKTFPNNTEKLKIGDKLIGYISSNRSPSIKVALWIHFSGLLQLPVYWNRLHDIHKNTMQLCINTSFQKYDDIDEDIDGDNNHHLSIYNPGDLVMAKVVDINQAENKIILSMKPSDLTVGPEKQLWFCQTFCNEWYLLYKQQQSTFIDSVESSQSSLQSSLHSLQIGGILKCKVSEIVDKETILVQFEPMMEGVIGIIKIQSSQNIKMYQDRLLEKKTFRCNILNIDWKNENPIIELYDPINLNQENSIPLDIIANDISHQIIIQNDTNIKDAIIIYISPTYLLIHFGLNINNKIKRFLGIVPVHLPYLIIPTKSIFNIGDKINVKIIEASNQYGGVILCNIHQQSLTHFIRRHNKTIYNNKNKKRKFSEIEENNTDLKHSNERPSKRQKTTIQSARSNICGTIYKAQLIQSNAEKKQFIIRAVHGRLPNISEGILPFEQLCDSYKLSMKLAKLYHQLLNNKKNNNNNDNNIDIMNNISVVITNITSDNIVIFSAKNMIVSHCENHSYPRFNAYQMPKTYNKIKRNVAMIGYINNISNTNDQFKIYHTDKVSSIVDYDDVFMLPFDRKEVDEIYHNGQTVIGHIENNCKLKQDKLSIKLCKLNNIENHDIIKTNQSFIKEYKNTIYGNYMNHMNDVNNNNNNYYLTTSDISIGNTLDVEITNVSSTLIEFEYQHRYKGKIIRPQHSGAEIEQYHKGMEIQIFIIDIDYDKNELFGSIRLSNKTPITLNQKEKQSLMNNDILCQLEWISDNGYFILQTVETNHLVIVPFDIPYFHFTFTQIYNLYFELGAKFKVSLIENINLNPSIHCNQNVFLGHIPSFIKVNGGYLKTKMIDTITNPTKYYKPYDLRFSHPAQIIYNKKNINNLSVKLCQITSQGIIAEFAPNFYPKIVVSAPDQDSDNYDTYLILEDKVDSKQTIKVNIPSNLNQIYSNSKRQITISIDDVIDIDNDNDNDSDSKINIIDVNNNNNESTLKCGQIVNVIIQSISKNGINVDILIKDGDKRKPGFIQPIHSDDSKEKVEKLLLENNSNIIIGQQCKAVVIDINDKTITQLSIQTSLIRKYNKLQNLLSNEKTMKLDVGQEINGIITKIVAEHGLFIDLGVFGIAQLHITNISNIANKLQDNIKNEINLKEMFKINEIIQSRIIDISTENNIIDLSIRHLNNPNVIEYPLSYNDIRKGQLLSGIVTMIDERIGVIVCLSRFIKGRISFKNLNIKNITYNMAINKFPIGTIINDISVLFVSPTTKRVELKITNISDKNKQKLKFLSYTIDQLDIGDFVNVLFQKKMRNGNLSVFVPSSDFKYGVIPKKEISSHLLKNNNIDQMIKGDTIQVWVFNIDRKQRNKPKVYFTMKSKSLKINKSIDFAKQQIHQIQQQNRQRVGIKMMKEYQRLQELKQKQEEDEDGEDEEEDDDIKPLDLNWNDDNDDNNDEEIDEYQKDEEDQVEDEDEYQDDVVMDDINDIKPSLAMVKMDIDNNENGEENIEWNELMKSEGFGKKPQKPSDFERLIVGSPDSSIIWIQYIAFYLTKKNTVKARNIIERALKEINFSADKERLNIWIAWMNLEILYGTEQTLIDVFKKALKSNDQKDVYIQFVGVCKENKKYHLCKKYYTEMLHKFRTDSSVYLNFGTFLYEEFYRTLNKQYLDQGRDLLKRGIQNLSLKSQHISLIQKFAWNEYKFVNKLLINKRQSSKLYNMDIKNEGQSMFEGLLKKYKNKANIWKLYALSVYKFGGNTNERLQNARDIFERGLNIIRMKQQDIKWLFKQYLSFEQKYGNRSPDHIENVAHIKQLAKKYVSSIQKRKNK